MAELLAVLEQNLRSVHQRIVAACDRVGRNPATVELIAVTKYVDLWVIDGLRQLGQRRFGENRPQQLLERAAGVAAEDVSDEPRSSEVGNGFPVEWHLIGPLQRNKVRSLLPVVARIHSVDSLRLLQRISRIAGEIGLVPRVLLEVNVSGESTKQGFDCDQLRNEWPEILTLPYVEVTGLMTMAPHSNDPESSRPHFRQLRELRDELATNPNLHDSTRSRPLRCSLDELSMGMSGDFEIAIEEGATHIRVGSSLFTGLPASIAHTP